MTANRLRKASRNVEEKAKRSGKKKLRAVKAANQEEGDPAIGKPTVDETEEAPMSVDAGERPEDDAATADTAMPNESTPACAGNDMFLRGFSLSLACTTQHSCMYTLTLSYLLILFPGAPGGFFSEVLFETLDICEPVKKALNEMKMERLTEIQAKAIPRLLEGKDVLGAAKTGMPPAVVLLPFLLLLLLSTS